MLRKHTTQKTPIPAKDKFRDSPWLPHEKLHLIDRIERMPGFKGILSPNVQNAFQVLLDIMDYMDEVALRNASAYLASPTAKNGSSSYAILLGLSAATLWTFPLLAPLLCISAGNRGNNYFIFMDTTLSETPEDARLKKAILTFLTYFGFNLDPAKATACDINSCLTHLYENPCRPQNRVIHTEYVLKSLFQTESMAYLNMVNLIIKYYGDGNFPKPEQTKLLKQTPNKINKVTASPRLFANTSQQKSVTIIFTKLSELIIKFKNEQVFNYDLITIAIEVRNWLKAAKDFLIPISELLQQKHAEADCLTQHENPSIQAQRASVNELLGKIIAELRYIDNLPNTAQSSPQRAAEQIRKIFETISKQANCIEFLSSQATQLLTLFDIVINTKMQLSASKVCDKEPGQNDLPKLHS
ncbi:MAG: hypothetical protein ACYCQI_04465 [Gammaproteobacteria bacterium]